MLFLYRPRQTWMPYRRPIAATEQAEYNRELQARFSATRRVDGPPVAPFGEASSSGSDLAGQLRALAQLHVDGELSDEEFAAAKASLLQTPPTPS